MLADLPFTFTHGTGLGMACLLGSFEPAKVQVRVMPRPLQKAAYERDQQPRPVILLLSGKG